MKQDVSVDKAIKRGHLTINVPVILCLIGCPALAVFLSKKDIIPSWMIAIAIILGLGLGWLIWSILITKWRIWAFEHVRNVHELKKRAIEEKLIWADGHVFEKTEIRSKKDQLKLDALDYKFREDDIYEEDPSVPSVTKIYYSKKHSIFILLFGIVTVIISFALLFDDSIKSYIIGSFLLATGGSLAFMSIKKTFNNSVQITIDNNGIQLVSEPKISWFEIYEDAITYEGMGKSSTAHLTFYDADDRFFKISLEDLKIKPARLEVILRTYRIRHSKNNT
ncbi:hypothetical protein [Psychroserpens luteolus]|uniref:hypothetical protein n=1 Tax=Psychroserpens luteolus TaxID=2855840 RepID=UPI001E2830C8|nr:hypothetical protein [Psychroserpens luteolus]MCD2260284.1 hypothetical protein [Psychroserpens luteolus]